MGGSRRMGSDDDFRIRQVLPVGARFCCWARWAWFFGVESMSITNYTLFTCNLIFFVHQGKREWVDGSGWLVLDNYI